MAGLHNKLRMNFDWTETSGIYKQNQYINTTANHFVNSAPDVITEMVFALLHKLNDTQYIKEQGKKLEKWNEHRTYLTQLFQRLIPNTHVHRTLDEIQN